jgi:peptidoglycan hydrolase-like protein with peptidoglycan-binding domain
MALRSKLFRASQKLEACLVDDRAHVTQGVSGEHVGLIQKALDAVGDEEICANEITSKTYGTSTAAAVLAYKRKHNIVNPSYQKQPDNIVGKMTIASLDKDMQRLEASALVISCGCKWHQKGLG